ncbi:MAG: BtpA/SgcQ family protein [Myxococcota bacterium]|jgi:membrane complex biogenesis BtpA family protein|nr:BtpA/SgcQ family protein [Myxococcota bacterium]
MRKAFERAPLRFVGVVHLPALPGDPAHDGRSFSELAQFAQQDARTLAEGGVDAIIIENFGSAPFPKGDASQRCPAHQAAFIGRLAGWCREHFSLSVGVNCLRNDIFAALGIAAANELDFVRVNVHTGAYLSDQGVIEGEAYTSMRYRASLGARHIAVLADVHVKHAVPLAPVGLREAARDTVERGLADAVIVTGSGTGEAVETSTLLEVAKAVPQVPVLLGSGLALDNVAQLASHAHGAIVGTALKKDGVLEEAVELDRVRAMAAALKQHLRPWPLR